jgi:hypothetical protein
LRVALLLLLLLEAVLKGRAGEVCLQQHRLSHRHHS